MGSDDLFHKRKSRSSYKRRNPYKKRKERILIVCEGEKTEVVYFKRMIKKQSLKTAKVKVTGESGSAPISVVDYAIEQYKDSKKERDPFDSVYCIYDKDSHPSFESAKDKLSRQKPKKVFSSIISVPCFEVWFLLHFNYSTAPFSDCGNSSICGNVIKKLEKKIPKYEKGMKDIPWEELEINQKKAIQNAKKLKKHNEASGTYNPSTNVYELVEAIKKLK